MADKSLTGKWWLQDIPWHCPETVKARPLELARFCSSDTESCNHDPGSPDLFSGDS